MSLILSLRPVLPSPLSFASDVSVLINIVNISIPTSIEHLKAKAPEFKKGGLTPTVVASLKLLLYDHDTFSAAVLAKIDRGIGAEKERVGREAVRNIHDKIQSGIEFFVADLV